MGAGDRQVAADFVFGRFEDQFVMHLQQHARRSFLVRQRARHPDHGAADDVGGRALDRRIDRRRAPPRRESPGSWN